MTTEKNPAAVALGRLGGQKKTENRKQAARDRYVREQAERDAKERKLKELEEENKKLKELLK